MVTQLPTNNYFYFIKYDLIILIPVKARGGKSRHFCDINMCKKKTMERCFFLRIKRGSLVPGKGCFCGKGVYKLAVKYCFADWGGGKQYYFLKR